MTRPLQTENWGRLPYEEAYERQKERVQARLDGACPDTLVFVEHPPVYTLGARKGAEAHLLWQRAQCIEHGISVVKTNRGGDITYHGPGQLVAYPIVDLRPTCDLHAWLRFLEEVIIAALSTYNLCASRREQLTGIWIEQRKIAAIGVAVRHWITYHGFALNVAPDLEHFSGIIPCGIQSEEGTVTSIQAELGEAPSMKAVTETTEHYFREAHAEYFS